MTKDNLGNEHWQSDQETIRSLYKQLKALADAEKAARAQNDELVRTVSALRNTLADCIQSRSKVVQERERLQAAIQNAVDVIADDGGTDGDHHKQWVLDQVLRVLLDEGYDAWIAEYNKLGSIPWDTGIAP